MRLEADLKIDDRYLLIRRIGSGGMADVWSADDQMLGRRVALKFLHERFGADEQFVERFRREAQAAAGLQHPNVVSVYDRGEHEGRYWIAMEYVEGAALKDLIERGLSPAESVEIVRQVLAGVRFAHDRGIVHRDLKPHNVLVDAEGRARVTDFGIARAGASEITQTGSVLGTAHYLSPEQAQGLETNASADLYSVGVILYEALTGRVPFDADTAVAIALKQISEPPVPPRQLNPEIPPALDAVVLKALQKDPADRFSSATEFLRALDEAEANPAAGGTAVYAAAVVDPEPEEDDNSRRNKLIALAIIALLLIAGIVFALTRSEQVLVPSVIGQTRAAATDKLEGAGFEVVASDFESCDEPNTVSETDPPAGTRADEGSEVKIDVSLGMEVAIPSKGVIDEPQAEATKKLQDENLQVETREVSSNGVEEGNVVETEPATGEKVECESVVTLLVSKGAQLVTVPDVTGQPEADAVAAIEAEGLIADVDEEDSDLPVDQVIKQSPGGGSEVKKRSVVKLTVSNGEGTVEVPNVIGQPEGTAVSTLQSRGATNVTVVPQDTEDESQDGRVIDQAPAAGTQIRASDEVTVYVGEFVEPEEPEEPDPDPDPDDGGIDETPRERGQRR
ncbi:MAG TPA: PASTA domain-containing protein [Solirubrobacterales bacterium]|nr:PASTA domain-containing protein [Solirubrobacterales bacterium]